MSWESSVTVREKLSSVQPIPKVVTDTANSLEYFAGVGEKACPVGPEFCVGTTESGFSLILTKLLASPDAGVWGPVLSVAVCAFQRKTKAPQCLARGMSCEFIEWVLFVKMTTDKCGGYL